MRVSSYALVRYLQMVTGPESTRRSSNVSHGPGPATLQCEFPRGRAPRSRHFLRASRLIRRAECPRRLPPPAFGAQPADGPVEEDLARRALTRMDAAVACHARPESRWATLEPAVDGDGTLHVTAPGRG